MSLCRYYTFVKRQTIARSISSAAKSAGGARALLGLGIVAPVPACPVPPNTITCTEGLTCTSPFRIAMNLDLLRKLTRCVCAVLAGR